jgi:hypothetical protein
MTNAGNSVADLKQLASELFEIERKRLLSEKAQYSCAVIVVVTPERRYYEEATFDNEQEMDDAYKTIVDRAKEQNAIAIITINAGREKDVDGEIGPYWWGKLAADNEQRTLFLTLSGPSLEPVSLSQPFWIGENAVTLGVQSTFELTIINMLPNWP